MHLSPEELRLWREFMAGVARLSPNRAGIMQDMTISQQPIDNPILFAPSLSSPAESRKPSKNMLALSQSVPAEWLTALQNPIPPTPSGQKQELPPGDSSAMNNASARRFRRGKLTLDATLDLHGLGVAAAQYAFTQFIAQSQQQGLRVVCVITGHGIKPGHASINTSGSQSKDNRERGILRASLPRWVNLPENRSRILAYDQAPPPLGGQGAYMVLLRRIR